MRMRDVVEEEQRRPRELYTRAKQNMSNRDEPRARDEGSRAGQRDARLLGAGCRSALELAGQDGRGLCWAGRQCRDGPEAWAPSSVGGAAEHLNDDVRDAVDLGLVGRCVEEEAGSTRAVRLRFPLRSSSRHGEEVHLQLQSANHASGVRVWCQAGEACRLRRAWGWHGRAARG